MQNETRNGVLSQIQNPLIFFSLALLIIEAIIGLAMRAADKLTGNQQLVILLTMSFLFLVVVSVVAIITVKWPHHLYQNIKNDLETSKIVNKFINGDGLKDIIMDVVADMNQNGEKRGKKDGTEQTT